MGRIVVSCSLTILLSACAITNTAQQELAYQRWAKCNSRSATLDRVEESVHVEIEAAVRFAIDAPLPAPEEVDQHVYADIEHALAGGVPA